MPRFNTILTSMKTGLASTSTTPLSFRMTMVLFFLSRQCTLSIVLPSNNTCRSAFHISTFRPTSTSSITHLRVAPRFWNVALPQVLTTRTVHFNMLFMSFLMESKSPSHLIWVTKNTTCEPMWQRESSALELILSLMTPLPVMSFHLLS